GPGAGGRLPDGAGAGGRVAVLRGPGGPGADGRAGRPRDGGDVVGDAPRDGAGAGAGQVPAGVRGADGGGRLRGRAGGRLQGGQPLGPRVADALEPDGLHHGPGPAAGGPEQAGASAPDLSGFARPAGGGGGGGAVVDLRRPGADAAGRRGGAARLG